MRLVVVRHGETEWNKERRLQGHIDTELSCLGKEQAEQIGRFFGSQLRSFHQVYASDLQRAHNTAHILCKAAGFEHEVRVDAAFRERDLGVLSGIILAECEDERLFSVVKRMHEDDYPLPEGESVRAFERRVMEGINKLAEQHLGEDILLISHGGAIRIILRKLLGGNFGRIKNTSITELEFCADRGWIVHVCNETPHLSDSDSEKPC